MARTIKEISQHIKTTFVSNPTMQDAYTLAPDKTFDDQFSPVSVESVLIHIVASSVWILEKLWDVFRTEVEEKIDNNYVASIAWYYHKALEFQFGDALAFDEKTYSFKYPTQDESKRIVKNVAIREVIIDNITTLKVYFSDEDKQPLKNEQKAAFELYMRQIGAAGTHYTFVTKQPDQLQIKLDIYHDPLVIDSSGNRLKGKGKPVEETIDTYLSSLEYGGTFYGSKLVDMLQSTEGVKDVVLLGTGLYASNDNIIEIDSRKIAAESGAFVCSHKEKNITYSNY